MNTYIDILNSPHILNSFKSRQPVPLKCMHCGTVYTSNKNNIQSSISAGRTKNFCSPKCNTISRKRHYNVTCKECGVSFAKQNKEIKKVKNHFCSRSCSNRFNAKNKKHGTRRSQLEVWIEEQIIPLYPDLEFHFNRKDTIGSELDIYIPSIKLAFELNGIFHYEPIFGENKLQRIQEGDSNKFQQCHANGISLYIIDTSSQNQFTPKSSMKFLRIITDIIDRSQS